MTKSRSKNKSHPPFGGNIEKEKWNLYTNLGQHFAGDLGTYTYMILHKTWIFILCRHDSGNFVLFGILCRKIVQKLQHNIEKPILMLTTEQHNNF